MVDSDLLNSEVLLSYEGSEIESTPDSSVGRIEYGGGRGKPPLRSIDGCRSQRQYLLLDDMILRR